MASATIHRLIEQQVSRCGDAPAIIDGRNLLTYRDLNERANRVARYLIERGLKRHSLVVVRMERSCELAVILLAILKAGAFYLWSEQDGDSPAHLVLAAAGTLETPDLVSVDVTPVLETDERSPNLPILTRESDIACALPNDAGSPEVLLPHATIASVLNGAVAADHAEWSGAAGALELWRGLTAGAVVAIVNEREPAAA